MNDLNISVTDDVGALADEGRASFHDVASVREASNYNVDPDRRLMAALLGGGRGDADPNRRPRQRVQQHEISALSPASKFRAGRVTEKAVQSKHGLYEISNASKTMRRLSSASWLAKIGTLDIRDPAAGKHASERGNGGSKSGLGPTPKPSPGASLWKRARANLRNVAEGWPDLGTIEECCESLLAACTEADWKHARKIVDAQAVRAAKRMRRQMRARALPTKTVLEAGVVVPSPTAAAECSIEQNWILCNEAFLTACEEGQTELVGAFASQGIDLEGHRAHGGVGTGGKEGTGGGAQTFLLPDDLRNVDSPLIAAVRNGHHDVAKSLLRAGAHADGRPGDPHDSALVIAAVEGDAEMVSLLLGAGAALNQVDHDGATPLFLAADHGNDEAMRLLLDQPDIDVHAPRAATEETPLYKACERGHHRMALRLLQRGARVADANVRGIPALHTAILNKHPLVVDVLVVVTPHPPSWHVFLVGCASVRAARRCAEAPMSPERLLAMGLSPPRSSGSSSSSAQRARDEPSRLPWLHRDGIAFLELVYGFLRKPRYVPLDEADWRGRTPLQCAELTQSGRICDVLRKSREGRFVKELC